MKKHLLMTTLLFAMALTACGNKQETVNTEEVVEEITEAVVEEETTEAVEEETTEAIEEIEEETTKAVEEETEESAKVEEKKEEVAVVVPETPVVVDPAPVVPETPVVVDPAPVVPETPVVEETVTEEQNVVTNISEAQVGDIFVDPFGNEHTITEVVEFDPGTVTFD